MLDEAIYKGATRPAMKFGIPLVPLVVVLGSAMLVCFWAGPFVSWWIAPAAALLVAPLLLWMRLVTRQDDQRLRQMVLARRLAWRDRNRSFWRSRSYAPYLYRGTPQ